MEGDIEVGQELLLAKYRFTLSIGNCKPMIPSKHLVKYGWASMKSCAVSSTFWEEVF
jgi:hypothetical protein